MTEDLAGNGRNGMQDSAESSAVATLRRSASSDYAGKRAEQDREEAARLNVDRLSESQILNPGFFFL